MKRYMKVLLLAAVIAALSVLAGAGALAEGWLYEAVSDTEAWLTGYDGELSGEVELPGEVGGYTVTGIREWAFEYRPDVTKFVVPGSVTEISSYAFLDCESLEEIVIRGDASLINEIADPGVLLRAPRGCGVIDMARMYGWKYAYLGEASEGIFDYIVLEDDTAMLTGLNAPAEGQLTFPAEAGGHAVSAVGPNVLFGSDGVDSVTVPEGVALIADFAFKDSDQLTRVYLPDDCLLEGYYSIGSYTVVYARYGSAAYESAKEYAGEASVAALGEQSEGDYEFMIMDDWNCAVITGYTGSGKNVTLPYMLGGMVVERIGAGAFRGNTGIETVVLPGCLAGIDADAFNGCTALTSVKAEEGVDLSQVMPGTRAFKDCVSLTEFDLGGSMRSVEPMCFEGCVSLAEIPCVDTLASIYDGAFRGCTGLTAAPLSGVRYLGEYAFAGCTGLGSVNIPAALGSVPEGCFEGCTSLESVTFPAHARNHDGYVDDYAFRGCTSLESVTFERGNSYKTIGVGVFEDCTALRTVNISMGARLQSIDSAAFRGCASLETILLPESLNSIMEGSFDGCENLTAQVVAGSYAMDYCENSGIEYEVLSTTDQATGLEYAADGETCVITGYTGSAGDLEIPGTLGGYAVVGIASGAFKGNTAIGSIALPEGVMSIGESAFADSTLSAIDMPGGLESLEMYAFENCVNLKEIEIPGSVYEIWGGAFSGCTALENVTLREGVGNIYNSAFSGCTALTELYLPYSMNWIAPDAFEGCTLKLRIIEGSSAEYYVNGMSWEYYIPETTIFAYSIYDDGTVSIYDVNALGMETDLVIPAQLDGYTVFQIDVGAFRGVGQFETVTVPESVTYIGYEAFDGCTNLTDAYLPADAWFADNAFPAHTTVWVPYGSTAHQCALESGNPVRIVGDRQDEASGLVYYVNENGEAWVTGVAEGVTGELVMPDELDGHPLTGVCTKAFESAAASLTSITVTDSVMNIEAGAFDGCEDMLFKAYSGSFAANYLVENDFGCQLLSRFTYDPIDILTARLTGYTGKVTEIFEIPDGVAGYEVVGIASGAFAEMTGVTQFILPEEVAFEADAFPAGALLRVPYGSASAQTAADEGMIFQYIGEMSDAEGEYIRLDGGALMQVRVADSFGDEAFISGCTFGEIAAVGPYAFHGTQEIRYAETDWCVETLDAHALDGSHNVELASIASVNALQENSVPASVTVRVMEDSAAHALCEEYGVSTIVIGGEYCDGYHYTLDPDGNAVVNLYDEQSINIVLRAELDGHPVARIEPGAFSYVGTLIFPEEEIDLAPMWAVWSDGMRAQVVEGSFAHQWCEASGVQYEFHTPGEFAWSWYEDEEGVVLEGCTGIPSGRIEIPAEFGGVPVTTVASYALCGYPDVTEVIVPEGVTAIGALAFCDCESLKVIELPVSVGYISEDEPFDADVTIRARYGSYAYQFAQDNGYKAVLPADLTTGGLLYALTDAGAYVLGSEEPINGALTVPANVDGYDVVGVMTGAFDGQSGLTSVSLPESCYDYGERAFAGTSIREIDLNTTYPDGLYLSPSLFEGCDQLETVTLSDLCWELPHRTFAGCTSLKELDLPDYVYYIGDACFENCTSLETLIIPDGTDMVAQNAFEGCESLTVTTYRNSEAHRAAAACGVGVEFNDEVDEATGLTYKPYGNYAVITGVTDGFDSASLTVPEMLDGYVVSGIKPYALSGLACLEELNLPDSIDSIGMYAFAFSGLREFTMPANLTYAAQGLLKGCENLESVTLHGGVDTLISETFMGCTALERVAVPEGVAQLEDDLFRGCTSLRDVTLPDALGGIGDRAFMDCTALETIYLPSGVEEMGEDVFAGCDSLTITAVKNSAGYWYAEENGIAWVPYGTTTADGRYAYEVLPDGTAKLLEVYGNLEADVVLPDTLDGYALTEIGPCVFQSESFKTMTLPDGVKRIGAAAFRQCGAATDIILPEGLEEIGAQAFSYCYSLNDLTLPDGLEKIGANAFEECRSFSSMTIPGSVTELPYRLFNNCIFMTDVTLGEGVEVIGEEAFIWCESLVNVSLPDTLKKIDDYAFQVCISLENIGIPASVEQVGDYVFADCFAGVHVACHAGLEIAAELQANDGNVTVEYYDSETFPGFDRYEISSPYGWQQLTVYGFSDETAAEVTLPAYIDDMPVYTIGEGAFAGLANLESITISEDICVVSDRAFADCPKLVRAELPESLHSIGDGVFDGCPDVVVYVHEYSYAYGFLKGVYPIEIIGGAWIEILPDELWVPVGTAFRPKYIPRGCADDVQLAFESIDESVLAVSSDGVITALSAGTAEIKVSDANDPEVYSWLIVHAGQAAEMIVPSSMTKIDAEAFRGSNAYVIDLSGVPGVEIGAYAFADCPNLTTLILPENAQVDMTFIDNALVDVFTPDAQLAQEIENHHSVYTVELY